MSRDATDTTLLGREPGGPLRWFLLIAGDGSLRRLALPDEGVVTIGRDESCDVIVVHGSISKQHAQLELGELPRLRDLGSKNGTWLGGLRLTEPTSVSAGEVFEVGPVTLVLKRGPALAQIPRDVEAPLVADDAVKRLYELLDSVAPSDLPVIVVGETGTGKEVVASMIHARSPRSAGPMVRINCAALPLTLFEAELFGHEEGAFTGAARDKRGLIEEAGGGTLFLDEIAEMPLEAQAKVLRAIEERTFYRVGGRRPVQVDVRFVAASNRDLSLAVREGRFRSDLYHRLNGITLRLPPLRARPSELIPLAQRFAREAAQAAAMHSVPPLSAAAEQALATHPWPGNVRELRNCMQRAVLLSRGGTIEPEHLVLDDDPPLDEPEPGPTTIAPPTRQAPASLRDQLQALEKRRIVEALDACAGNQTRTAAMLGISRRTLIARLEAYSIARPTKE